MSNGLELRYHDVRKFGVMEIRSKDNILTTKPISELGMEPLTDEFTFEKLIEKMNVKMELKQFLLDQRFICGIGNIYADEICYLAHLHPKSICNKLSKEEIYDVFIATNQVIDKAVKAGGTTIRSYTSSLGVTGRFQLELNCHTLVGKPCKVCQTPIIKTKVGGRGTYLCEKCQILKD